MKSLLSGQYCSHYSQLGNNPRERKLLFQGYQHWSLTLGLFDSESVLSLHQFSTHSPPVSHPSLSRGCLYQKETGWGTLLQAQRCHVKNAWDQQSTECLFMCVPVLNGETNEMRKDGCLGMNHSFSHSEYPSISWTSGSVLRNWGIAINTHSPVLTEGAAQSGGCHQIFIQWISLHIARGEKIQGDLPRGHR